MPDKPDPAAVSPRLPEAVQALDAAVRGISGVLDVEQVLQLIVDRVRELVAAQYAALGIVETGGITRFITSGITAEQRRAIGDLPRGRGLLGLIIRENRSYRIPNIARIPRATVPAEPSADDIVPRRARPREGRGRSAACT